MWRVNGKNVQQSTLNFQRSATLRRRGRRPAAIAGAWRAYCAEGLERRVLLSTGVGKEPTIELFNASPALFVRNDGQWADQSVRFAFQGAGTNVLMTDAGPVFQIFQEKKTKSEESGVGSGELHERADGAEKEVEAAQFSMTFEGANAVRPVGVDRAGAQFNYFVGNDKSQWRSGVAAFETVEYPGLYNGIDLVTWGRRGGLKYEFHVAPGAEWRQIEVRYSGIEGLSIDEAGALHVRTKLGDVVDDAPVIYQVIDGKRVEVSGQFELVGRDVCRFRITGSCDASRELVIDPDVAWASYLGGGGDDFGYAIAADQGANAFVTGRTRSTDFSGANNADPDYGFYDAFVAKVSASGSLLWATYLGGSSHDYGRGIAADGFGNALVTGETISANFPGANNAIHGSDDVFVAKVSGSGSLLWATYLGGSGRDDGYAIAGDGGGNALVTGWTRSTNFSGVNNTFHGSSDYYDGFVAKVSGGGSLVWATFLGGSGDDYAYSVAADAAGDALVVAYTESTDFFGTNNTFYGYWDALAAKVSAGGLQLWASYLGGSAADGGYSVAVDGAGNALVTGFTGSTNFSGANNTYHYWDAFAAKLSGSGSLLWATYLGGSSDEYGCGVAADGAGNALVTGVTKSTNFFGASNAKHGGDYDAFVTKISGNGSLLWATYLGGGSSDLGRGIAVDEAGNAIVTGETSSATFSGANNAYHSGTDGFVAKVIEPLKPAAGAVYAINGAPGAQTLTISAGSVTFVADAGSTYPNLVIVVASGARVEFEPSQQLGGLSVVDGGVAVMEAGAAYLQTAGLTLGAGAALDLNDNDLIVSYSGASPFAQIQQWVIDGLAFSPDPTRTGIISTTGQNATAAGGMILALLDNNYFWDAPDPYGDVGPVGLTEWPLGSGNTIALSSVIPAV